MHVGFVLAWLAGFSAAAQSSSQPSGPLPRRRYEFKNSLKGPFSLYERNEVLFWDVSGSALVNSDNVRLVPSAQHRKGAVWNRFPVNYAEWEIRVDFSIFGRRYGADGLGIWYSLDKGEGNTFGGPSTWRGLGIFVDTYDNDSKGDNPAILGVVNDGTLQYDHDNDGSGQSVGNCLANVRNTVHPVILTARYSGKRLEVTYDTWKGTNPQVCFAVDGVELPLGGFFGVTAATGALADDHDLYKFDVWDLSPQDKKVIYADTMADTTVEVNVDELKELEEAFLKQQAEVEKQQRANAEVQTETGQAVGRDTSDVMDRAKLMELVDAQRLLSRQVEVSFNSISQHIEQANEAFTSNFNFIKQQQKQHALQLSQEPTAEGVLGPKLQALMKELTTLNERLVQLDKSMTAQHKQTKQDVQNAVKEDIGLIRNKVAQEGSWATMLMILFVLEGFCFLMYLIWRRQADSAYRKFI